MGEASQVYTGNIRDLLTREKYYLQTQGRETEEILWELERFWRREFLGAGAMHTNAHTNNIFM